MNFDELTQADLIDVYLLPWGIRIVTALLIFIIGRWLAKVIVRASEGLMTRARLDSILIKFVNNIVYMLLIAVVVLAALEQLGVKTTSALAILGAAGLAVGLALKDSLSNFAAGTMLIIFRPFKLGDYIEAGGTSGVVEGIHIFSTLLKTGDNREIIVPNSQIYGGTIINYNARPTRRIDMVIGIGYGDDIRKAKSVLEEIIKAEPRILEEPAPAISVADLAESSINLNVRPWVSSGDYWAVRSDLLETIKGRFDEQGISIPYPQRDVHLYETK